LRSKRDAFRANLQYAIKQEESYREKFLGRRRTGRAADAGAKAKGETASGKTDMVGELAIG
jgi:hypothetical protein